MCFSPFDFCYLFITLVFCGLFFQSDIYLVFMFFFTIILEFDQKITCCLLISTFLRKSDTLEHLNYIQHPFDIHAILCIFLVFLHVKFTFSPTVQYIFIFMKICRSLCSWRITFLCYLFTFFLFHHILLQTILC